MRNAEPATALAYSAVIPLLLPATSQEWSLWAGATDEEHLSDPVIATARSRFWMKSIALILFTASVAGALRWQFDRRRMMTLRNEELEAGIARPTPIVALTANAFGHDEAACRDAGMTAFLSKPFTRDALAETLKRCREDNLASTI